MSIAKKILPNQLFIFLKISVHGFNTLIGFVSYALGKRNLEYAYQNFVLLFCYTGGRSNYFFSQVVNLFRKKGDLSRLTSIFPKANTSSLEAATSQLNDVGYHIFDTPFPAHYIESFEKLAYEMPLFVYDIEGKSGPKNVRYDPSNLLGVRYDTEPHQLLSYEMVQDIVADKKFLSLAQEYLGCAPKLDFVIMWWSTSFQKDPDKNAAQYYHFDLERLKWLKFFIYLTDVGPENGPHCFIKGTHKPGTIPDSLLEAGYKRMEDADVFSKFPDENKITFTGKRGTIIAEDTIGLHKGQHLQSGHRLILQLQYTNCLFGSHVSHPRVPIVSEKLRSIATQYPHMFNHCFEI